MGKNLMIEFAKTNRTTSFFKGYMIAQIRIAYRIMEYLAPDSVFEAKDLDSKTKELMLYSHFTEAYGRILNTEVIDSDIGSSHWGERLEHEAIELMTYLLPLYEQGVTDAKERRIIELRKELRELEAPEQDKE